MNRLRKEARGPATDSSDALADRDGPDGSWAAPAGVWSLDTPEALLAAKDMQAVIKAALKAVPANQRAVLTLKDVEELPFEETCNILEIAASNARVLLHRARRHLWSAIEQFQKG